MWEGYLSVHVESRSHGSSHKRIMHACKVESIYWQRRLPSQQFLREHQQRMLAVVAAQTITDACAASAKAEYLWSDIASCIANAPIAAHTVSSGHTLTDACAVTAIIKCRCSGMLPNQIVAWEEDHICV